MKKNIYNIYQEEQGDDASDSDRIDPKDDEEIDEDGVFNDSDEEKFGSYFPGKDDDETDEDDIEDDDENQGNLSDLLKRENLDDLINAQHSDEQLEDFSDSESEGSVKDLSMLVSKKRKILDLNAKQGEFSIPSAGKLSLSDLMSGVQEETSFGALKKKLKNLENASKIDAPAATRIKNRMDRIAAYEEANKKVSKWTPLVKKNREADHLSFDQDKAINMTSSALVSQFNPMNDMELEIQNLIKESGMGEDDVAENEELKSVNISKDQLMERQKELSKMRALCFFKEQKQKKIAKIKSKVYRKLHRKKKIDALDLDLEELKKIDPLLAEERAQKLELDRAKERVSLKHKNTSKWAKQMLNRKDNDPETRMALMNQLEKHQQLKKRITGIDSDDSDHLENDENLINKLDDLEKELDNVTPPRKGLMGMKFMQRAMDRQKSETKEMIQNVRDLDDYNEDDISENDSISSAEKKSDEGGKEDSDENDGYLSNESEDFKEEDLVHGIQTSGPVTVGGIKQLEPLFKVEPFEIQNQSHPAYFGNVNKPEEIPEQSASEPSEGDRSDLISEHSVDEPEALCEAETDGGAASAASNPWLEVDVSDPLQKSQKSEHVDGMARSAHKLEKHKKKLEKEQEENIIQLDLELKEDLGKKNGSDEGDSSDGDDCIDEKQDEPDAEDDLESRSDTSNIDEESNVITDINKLSRSDIMRMTFENDNVVEEFENEKNKMVERDMPKEEDLTLPGWGSWGGVGVKPQKQKRIVKTLPGIEAEKRKDAKLKHVIINEKRLKKSIQYLVPQVPHGFENRDQYERTIRMPIGKEWNTQNIYLEKIAPRIEKKLGVAIQPLKFVSAGKKASGRRKF